MGEHGGARTLGPMIEKVTGSKSALARICRKSPGQTAEITVFAETIGAPKDSSPRKIFTNGRCRFSASASMRRPSRCWRAITARTKSGDLPGAVVDAIALADVYFDGGQVAIGKGWVARASDWASEVKDPATTSLVLWMKSKVAAFEGEPEQALSLSELAYAAVRHKDDVNVEALSLGFRGFYRLCLGDTRAGIDDQDQAATLARSSNKLDPVVGGILYCNVLWSSRMFGDWARADQWTRGYESFCSNSGMELTGWCQLHRFEVLGIRGSLDEALVRIEDALAKLAGDNSWAVGDAHRVLGDVQAAIGDDEAALENYNTACSMGWCPEPGRAMLLLERGDAEAAYAGLERSLLGRNWWTLQRRGILLAHLAVVAAHTGDRAAALVSELSGSPDRWPVPIRALTNEAQAVLALAGKIMERRSEISILPASYGRASKESIRPCACGCRSRGSSWRAATTAGLGQNSMPLGPWQTKWARESFGPIARR
jgi:hypothetical protein